MGAVRIPWGAWYGDGGRHEHIDLATPPGWRVSICRMRGGPDIGESGLRAALDRPFGAPRLREVARGKRSAAVLVDDLSRPTPAFRVLPLLLEELAAGGITTERVRVIAAVAAHRALTRDDFVKKVGRDVVERVQTCNHDAYDNLDFLGHSSRGIPVFVNRDLMACEIRIALGMITPRGSFFGGGSKLLLPGACGHVTIVANHRYVADGFRDHIEEVAEMAGLDYIVNPLLNEDLEITGIVAGAPRAAFAEGVAMARQLYRTPVAGPVDVAVCNAFPKDTELLQAPLALVPLHGHEHSLRPGATVVIATACPEGLGWHSVFGPGTQLGGHPSCRPGTIVFSPNVTRWDVEAKFGRNALHCATWEAVTDEVARRHGGQPDVAIYTAGAMQYTGA